MSDFRTSHLYHLDEWDTVAMTWNGFLVPIVFCLFADDTGVFEPRDSFVELVETRTSENEADLGPWLAQLFQVMDTPEGQHPTTLDADLARLPCINGDLFKGPLSMVSCNAAMGNALR